MSFQCGKLVGWLLEFYVLATTKSISQQTCGRLWDSKPSWIKGVRYVYLYLSLHSLVLRIITIGKGWLLVDKWGHQHHDQIFNSVNVSWHWTNQFLPYPINTEDQARKRQVSILKSLVWLDQVSKLRIPRCKWLVWLKWEAELPISCTGGLHSTNLATIHYARFVCLLLLDILATSKVISGRVLTCDSAHSWRLL